MFWVTNKKSIFLILLYLIFNRLLKDYINFKEQFDDELYVRIIVLSSQKIMVHNFSFCYEIATEFRIEKCFDLTEI